jgi:phage baseplate assembly protein W
VAVAASLIANEPVAVRRGILTPLRRESGDFANGSEAALVASMVGQVLGTRCADGLGSRGEIPWAPTFGSLIYKLRHQNVTPVLRYQARAYVVNALARWVRQVRVTDVQVDNSDPRHIKVTTYYTVTSNLAAYEREVYKNETLVSKAA